MKVGEIWENKITCERVKICKLVTYFDDSIYIVIMSGDKVGYECDTTFLVKYRKVYE